MAFANLLVEKAPEFLRIAHNEEDRTTDPQPEAAHFLKFRVYGEERRMGRDLELYAFMAFSASTAFAYSHMLEELILPLRGYSAPAYTAGLAWMLENTSDIETDLQEEWKKMITGLQAIP